jgi:hypothetical protein
MFRVAIEIFYSIKLKIFFDLFQVQTISVVEFSGDRCVLQFRPLYDTVQSTKAVGSRKNPDVM